MLGARNASHFDAPAGRLPDLDVRRDRRRALAQLDDGYAAWATGVRGLGEEGLGRPCGPAEGPYAEEPLAALVSTSTAR